MDLQQASRAVSHGDARRGGTIDSGLSPSTGVSPGTVVLLLLRLLTV